MNKQEKCFDLLCKAGMVELELLDTFSPEQEAMFWKMQDLQTQAERVEEGY